MKVAELWRYPVKSMAGEQIDKALLGALGVAGDRVVHGYQQELQTEVTVEE